MKFQICYLVMLIIIFNKGQVSAVASCFQCEGLNCEPDPKYLLPCQTYGASCFFVAWNSSGIFRGCYERGAKNLDRCNDNRLTSCVVCHGNGCNNQPIFMDEVFSCRKCDWGECSEGPHQKINYHQCERFVTGSMPGCFIRFLYAYRIYKFGCVNEMTKEDYDFCYYDKFQANCHICDFINCNNYFYMKYYETSLRISCYNLPSVRYTYICHYWSHKSVPIVGCTYQRYDATDEYTGSCFNMITEDQLLMAYTHGNMFVCTESFCNQNKWDPGDRNICSSNGLFPSVLCSSTGEPCMRYSYKDEEAMDIIGSNCLRTIPCYRREYCTACISNETATEPCNKPEIGYPYKCFMCETEEMCAFTNEYSLNKTTGCNNKQDPAKTECFTYAKGNEVARGCYYPGVEWYQNCKNNPQNCLVCDSDLCNDQDVKGFCYQCDYLNRRCGLDQTENYLDLCEMEVSIHKTGCYIMMRWDGLVSRGCFDSAKEFVCPLDHTCETCFGNGCNYISVASGSCLVCDGFLGSACGNDQQLLHSGKLSIPCQINSNEPLCYTILTKNSTWVTRGCTSKTMYREKMKRLCGNGNYICHFCDEDNCNNYIVNTINAVN